MDDRFYITGGTLPLDADSYVTRRADAELFEYLRRGEFCYVLNTRQVGKSSLMVRVAQSLRTEGVRVVLLDPTAIGVNVTVEEWYDGLLTIIAEQLSLRNKLEDFWLEHPRLGPMQRWMQALEHVALAQSEEPLCIFVDEIDSVQSLPFSADEFFGGIRECYNRRAYNPAFGRLTFCLLGVAAPVDLIADARITPFNIGKRIELTDFTPGEAAPLANGLGNIKGEKEKRRRGEEERMDSSFILHPSSLASSLNRVLYWTGGHPYLTQKLCSALAQSGSVPTAADVDAVCSELFLSRRAQKTDDNLAFARSRLLYEETNRATLLDMYQQILDGRKIRDDATNPLHSVLRLSGIVQANNGLLTIRNRIYAHVFNKQWARDNMPGEELRRQKRAYRLGVLRTASAAALLLMVIVGFGARAFFAEQNARASAKTARKAQRQAQEESERSSRLLYATRMNLLQRAYEEKAIGRARDLLTETASSPYRGFEWNYWNRLLRFERLAISITKPQSLVVWSRDGQWIVTQTQSTIATPQISLWDAKTGSLVRTLPGRAEALQGVASPVAADCVALVDAPAGQIGTVRLVNPTTGATRHILPIRASGATLSGDGKRVFTLEPQPNARALFKTWDVEHGTLLFATTVSGAQLFGTLMQMSTVQSTPDSRLLCFGSAYVREKCAFTLLDTTNGKRLWTPPGEYNRYGFAASGNFLVATKQAGHAAGRFEVWDLQARRQIAMLRSKKPEGSPSLPSDSYMLFTLRFSPNERWIAGAGEDGKFNGSIWLWDRTTGKELRVLPGRRRVVTAEFAADGRSLFSTARDNSLRIWNTATGEAGGAYPNDNINPPVPSSDSKEFLTADRSAVLVYPLASRPLPENSELVQASGAQGIYMRFHPDGRHLRLTEYILRKPRLPDTISMTYVYDLQTKEGRILPFDRALLTASVGDGAYAVNFRYTPAGGLRMETRNTLTGWRACMLHDPLPNCWIGSDWPGLAAILYDGKIPLKKLTPFNRAGRHQQVVLWNAETGKEVLRLTRQDLPYTPWQVRPKCGTRKLVIIDTENIAHIWNTSPLREVFHVSLGAITQVREGNFSISPDGKYMSVLVAENLFDGRIEVYDTDTGSRCAQDDHAFLFQPLNAFSPDGKYRIWADGQQNVHLMEGATGKEARLLKSIGGDFICAAFSPDGTRIATGTNIGTVKLWDVATGSELMQSRQAGEVGFISFSPDGARLGFTTSTINQTRAFIWETGASGQGEIN